MSKLRTARTTIILTLLTLASLASASALAQTGHQGTERAAWLLGRSSLEGLALTGERFEQNEIGSGGSIGLSEDDDFAGKGSGPGAGLTILASAILPGAGEALMGYRRGYLMMAADIFCWTRVAKFHSDGKDFTDDYYAFADEHYTDELLFQAYYPATEDQERLGAIGLDYFPNVDPMGDISDLENLPLYVTVEDDRREYYENLGKWDQFIFGWDDFLNPNYWGPLEYDYEPTGEISDLRQPWVSRNREIYRDMRDAANDAYKNRDRYLYVNMGLRIFSVFQVAYLNGLLGGGDEMKVAGHTVELITEPRGWDRGTLAAKVSF
jgi:hypothetical protein